MDVAAPAAELPQAVTTRSPVASSNRATSTWYAALKAPEQTTRTSRQLELLSADIKVPLDGAARGNDRVCAQY